MADELIIELGPNTIKFLEDLASNPTDPPTIPPDDGGSDPVYIYDQSTGNQSAPVYDTDIKGNGRLEPSEKILGRVSHGNQVLLLVFPANMALTFVKADWWYMYVVGVGITGWVKKKAGRMVIVRTT